MKNITEFIKEGRLDHMIKTLTPFETSCCQQGIVMYYAYILKHNENVYNGMASLEQLEQVYNRLSGRSSNDLKKRAEQYKDFIK